MQLEQTGCDMTPSRLYTNVKIPHQSDMLTITIFKAAIFCAKAACLEIVFIFLQTEVLYCYSAAVH